ncbi:MAG: YbjN domain-containing protein [Phascolarctobacterium sp.]|nr:YbjN domain-containing protein [Phascolarctobacterium sp.]
MNTKAEKFSQFLQENNLQMFQQQEVEGDMHPVVYRTFMEVGGQNLPTMLVIDDSIYVMLQVRVAAGVVKENNQKKVMDLLNQMNGQYKVFKYYVDGEGSIVLESCIPTTDTEFVPGLVHAVIDVVVKHLNEHNAETMKAVWAE